MANDHFRTADVALGAACALPAGDAARRVAKRGMRSRLLGLLLVVCAAAGLWQLAQGLYIHAKAKLAQYLIAGAWDKTLAGQHAVKPWPWADTWPVARLQTQLQSLYVLAGADGRAIAFGPGHMHGTPLPGTSGNSVIGGHRDTHFAVLRDLEHGDALAVQRADGGWRRYRVSATQVLDKSEVHVTRNDGLTRLTLVTCWPFNAIRAGGPQRYVVTATAEGD
jgi:sortase A